MTTLNTLLQQMDGMNTKDNVVVMAATNYPWQLDSAFLRRFSTTIGIQLPTMGDIYDLLSLRMTKHFAQGILDPEHALTYDEANKMCIRLPP
jgi:SpoVK/Ycf46/Vps4 family AAA+-type ATPase